MRVLGFEITRANRTAAQPVEKSVAQLNSVQSRGGWWPLVRESYAGAWQQNVTVELTDVLSYATVFACASLIASDIAKMRLRLVEQDENGIWTETKNNAAFSPVLRKPNHFQTRIKFVESWIQSKLIYGNTYALKERDARRVVTAMYVLDPQRVTPLVSTSGDVYYRLNRDDLCGVPEDVIVPASEIIHDVMVALYHPLVGVSPIYACGLAAVQGLKIQTNSANLFANGSNPGGVLTAPGSISDATANRIRDYWNDNYTGINVGKVAVLGDGLKFEKMALSAVDAQLIDQLKWTSENVCSAFHVPPYMVGVGPPPNYNNIEALNQQYYSQCLQILVESMELALDEGLGLGPGFKNAYGTEFDIDDLLRMDSATAMTVIKAGVDAGVMKPNEGRFKLNYGPVPGGDTPYLQAQYTSLAAIGRRDALAMNPPEPPPVGPQLPAEPDADEEPNGEADPQMDAADMEKAFTAGMSALMEISA